MRSWTRGGTSGVVLERLAPRWLAVLAVLAGLMALALAGCATAPTPPPLQPSPVEYADTLPIHPPASRMPNQVKELVKVAIGGEIGEAFSMRKGLEQGHEALNVTPFDDVLNSAWFEHRNGSIRLAPADVARGPTTTGPDTSAALTVIGGKSQGISPGFTIRDASGTVFRVKFDPRGNLHLASGAGVVSSRLFWAAGYNTPEDYIMVFDASRLVLDPGAEVADDLGFERPMVEGDVQAILALTDPLPDGRYLAIASKQLPGKDLGPFLFHGVRPDDPNDYYHHEHRRELRGLYVMSEWLNHVDMRYENSLDLFVSPPGFVRHYLIDFAATLGSGTVRSHRPREGVEYNFDFWPSMLRIFSLGFFTAGWEDRKVEPIDPSIGWMPVEEYDPAVWKANWPNRAFNNMTVRDAYWGAKLVGSFDDQQLRAVVEQARYPTRHATDTLTRILAFRRDRTIGYWYGRVTPIENIHLTTEVAGGTEVLEVSFEDLGLPAGIWRPEETRYAYRFEHPARSVSVRGELGGEESLRAEEQASRAAGSWRQVVRFALDPASREGQPDLSDRERIATLTIAAQREGADGARATIYLRWLGPGEGYLVAGLTH